MNSFTPANKQTLANFLAATPGKKALYLSYDPTTVVGTPEADALAAGCIFYYREDTARLKEVIYTR